MVIISGVPIFRIFTVFTLNILIFSRCTDLINGYNCSCEAGYTGQNCEVNINECVLEAEPCKNGGHCVDGVSQFLVCLHNV